MTKIETKACDRRLHPATAQDDLIDIDSLISDSEETWLFSIDEEYKQKKLDLWNLERSDDSRKLLVYKLYSISRQLDGDHSKDLETRNTLDSHQRSSNLLHLSPIPPCSIVDTKILTHIPLSSDSSFHSPNIPVPLMLPEEFPSPPGVCKDLVPQLASTPSRNVAPPRSDHNVLSPPTLVVNAMNFNQTPVTISEDTLLLPSTQTMLADLITFSPNLSLNKETEVVCPPSISPQPQSRCYLTTSSHVLNGCVTPTKLGQEANEVHNLMCSLPSPTLHSNNPLHSTQTLSLTNPILDSTQTLTSVETILDSTQTLESGNLPLNCSMSNQPGNSTQTIKLSDLPMNSTNILCWQSNTSIHSLEKSSKFEQTFCLSVSGNEDEAEYPQERADEPNGSALPGNTTQTFGDCPLNTTYDNISPAKHIVLNGSTTVENLRSFDLPAGCVPEEETDDGTDKGDILGSNTIFHNTESNLMSLCATQAGADVTEVKTQTGIGDKTSESSLQSEPIPTKSVLGIENLTKSSRPIVLPSSFEWTEEKSNGGCPTVASNITDCVDNTATDSSTKFVNRNSETTHKQTQTLKNAGRKQSLLRAPVSCITTVCESAPQSVHISGSAPHCVEPTASAPLCTGPSVPAERCMNPSATPLRSVQPSAAGNHSVRPSAVAPQCVRPPVSAAQTIRLSATALQSVKPSISTRQSVRPSAHVPHSVRPSDPAPKSIRPSVLQLASYSVPQSTQRLHERSAPQAAPQVVPRINSRFAPPSIRHIASRSYSQNRPGSRLPLPAFRNK